MKVKKAKRILFICRRKIQYGDPTCGHSANPYEVAWGLINSARLASEALKQEGYESKVILVTDANDIDREVYNYQPDVVFIEALWVTPDKFRELFPLHPNVRWVVRVHSKPAFLANEGMAIKWLKRYFDLRPNLTVSFNNAQFNYDIKDLLGLSPLESYPVYLPNLYPFTKVDVPNKPKHNSILEIGCFGAIRPMKNHLEQAIAAMLFANQLGKKLWFNINGTRLEQGGESVLKNLKQLFAGTPHTLELCEWETYKDFLNTIGKMDISMCVSLSETFSIVSADAVATGVPIVVSPEVYWASDFFKADPNTTDDILAKLDRAYFWNRTIVTKLNRRALNKANDNATKLWLSFLKQG